jgi:hypothetical protein
MLRVDWLLEEAFHLGQAVFTAVIVECLLLHVVENEAVVKYAHFQVGKTEVIHAFLGQAFPVTDRVIGDVADCPADKSEFTV